MKGPVGGAQALSTRGHVTSLEVFLKRRIKNLGRQHRKLSKLYWSYDHPEEVLLNLRLKSKILAFDLIDLSEKLRRIQQRRRQLSQKVATK